MFYSRDILQQLDQIIIIFALSDCKILDCRNIFHKKFYLIIYEQFYYIYYVCIKILEK